MAALHYRAAPDAEFDVKAAAQAAAATAEGLVWQAGKMVVEVKPAAAHKGTALRTLAAQPPFADRRPVMLGDDTTDEDAIAAAQALGGVGVKVGPGASAASLRAPDPRRRARLARPRGCLTSRRHDGERMMLMNRDGTIHASQALLQTEKASGYLQQLCSIRARDPGAVR